MDAMKNYLSFILKDLIRIAPIKNFRDAKNRKGSFPKTLVLMV